ncbi:hypothetical protein ODJ79_41725 [Actinoplanes sp. KI2]|uniref:hypothetical protein n=1 Tax=Actinoplanes sp. KI2 TaxID=2983315 RepID=UPI0021D5D0B1|nr:hypothetical protein [Actinoplanes sp. KI2]MCU7730277.1 hypothetical protein [Actinoplanes sp. KI2]
MHALTVKPSRPGRAGVNESPDPGKLLGESVESLVNAACPLSGKSIPTRGGARPR